MLVAKSKRSHTKMDTLSVRSFTEKPKISADEVKRDSECRI
jgi:hypothetical protein